MASLREGPDIIPSEKPNEGNRRTQKVGAVERIQNEQDTSILSTQGYIQEGIYFPAFDNDDRTDLHAALARLTVAKENGEIVDFTVVTTAAGKAIWVKRNEAAKN